MRIADPTLLQYCNQPLIYCQLKIQSTTNTLSWNFALIGFDKNYALDHQKHFNTHPSSHTFLLEPHSKELKVRLCFASISIGGHQQQLLPGGVDMQQRLAFSRFISETNMMVYTCDRAAEGLVTT